MKLGKFLAPFYIRTNITIEQNYNNPIYQGEIRDMPFYLAFRDIEKKEGVELDNNFIRIYIKEQEED